MILRELREIDQATDDILIYGNDGTTNQKIKTDSTGRPDIVSDNLDVALSTLKSVLDTINANTDTLEAKTQSIRDQLDVVLSSRASQATTQSILNALGEVSGTDIVNQLQTLNNKDFATENTLIEVRDFLDTVEIKLQLIIDQLDVNLSTRASESTLTEVLDTIGQESGSTVLSKLEQVDNTLDEFLTPFPGLAFRGFVTNGGSPDLNVDGSITPVDFTIAPPSGKIWYVHNISLVIEDNAINFTKFGGLLALTNGVDFKVKQNGSSEESLANIKNNGEFYTFANQVLLESSAIDILVIQVNTKINTGTTFKLINSAGDNFKVIINDDLTSINKFQIVVRGYEVDA